MKQNSLYIFSYGKHINIRVWIFFRMQRSWPVTVIPHLSKLLPKLKTCIQISFSAQQETHQLNCAHPREWKHKRKKKHKKRRKKYTVLLWKIEGHLQISEGEKYLLAGWFFQSCLNWELKKKEKWKAQNKYYCYSN